MPRGAEQAPAPALRIMAAYDETSLAAANRQGSGEGADWMRPQLWPWALSRHRATITAAPDFGFGLAFAILLDATVVRLLLAPAVMAVAGGANWWLPTPKFLRQQRG
ncbi:hypothetical protein ACOBQB_03365 [Streptomyces sp. G5(2025)]|uniref:hypothetical protein n=1 Tax=Streptomyces sp. G5(2025) TaxID=3406628 RepID=UPI003C27617A